MRSQRPHIECLRLQPGILHADNGGEFGAETVESLRQIWSDMKIAIQKAIKIKRTEILIVQNNNHF